MSRSASTPSASSTRPRRRVWRWILLALAVILLLMQGVRFVVPDFRLDNPPVTRTIAWDSAETQQLFTQACADCHSNETVYPWYARMAPMGWLVAYDVHEGRAEFNISQAGEDGLDEMDEMDEVIREREMPLPIYLPLHPEARLTDAQRQALLNGIEASFR